jgi:hypothetical protein
MDPSDNLHVVCKESIIFRSHQDIIAADFGFLLQTVLKYSLQTVLKYRKHDPSRVSHSNQSGRVNIGCGGLAYDPKVPGQRTKPKTLIGMDFVNGLPRANRQKFLWQLGTLMDFLFLCMRDI